MDTETYNLIIIVITAAFMIVTTAALYIVNQARKDANGSVPPDVAKTLADALPPSLLPILIAVIKGAMPLADTTPTTADNELLAAMLKQLQPTVSEITEGAEG